MSSLDWMVSIGLVPVSYALTGPVAVAFGGVLMGMLLFLPGVRDPEREPADATVDLPTFGERDAF